MWRTYEPAWLLIATYATVLTTIAAIQTRFAGQLTLPISLLAGVGVVYLLTTVDLLRTPSLFATTENQPTATPVVESNTQLQPTIGVPD